MGNEQAVPQQNQNQNNANNLNGPLYKMAIIIRGSRRTGKTTLVTRIKGFPFDDEYQATSSIEITEIPWISPDNENVLVNAWDTVEHIKSKIDKNPNQNDATSVDTIKKADGLVIMVDQFSDASIELAKNLIIEAPDELPIAVFSNFMDVETATPVIPTALTQYMGRFFYIPGSLKTNQGLTELAKWLSLPLLLAKSKLAYQAYENSNEEYKASCQEFIDRASQFLDSCAAFEYLESAKRKASHAISQNDEYSTLADENAPSQNSPQNVQQNTEKHQLYKKPYQRRPLRRAQTTKEKTNAAQTQSIEQQQHQQVTKRSIAQNQDDDDDFWKDDDEPEQKPQTKVIRKRTARKSVTPTTTNDDDDDVIRPNPLVVRPKQQQTVAPKVVKPVAVSPSETIHEETESPTKKKKILRKRSTTAPNPSPQTTTNSSASQQPQYALKRKRKQSRRPSRNVAAEEPVNEGGADGYEAV